MYTKKCTSWAIFCRRWKICLSVLVQGANVSCVSGWLRVWGSIQALSAHQRALIIQTSHMNLSSTQGDVCSSPTTGRYTSTCKNDLVAVQHHCFKKISYSNQSGPCSLQWSAQFSGKSAGNLHHNPPSYLTSASREVELAGTYHTVISM